VDGIAEGNVEAVSVMLVTAAEKKMEVEQEPAVRCFDTSPNWSNCFLKFYSRSDMLDSADNYAHALNRSLNFFHILFFKNTIIFKKLFCCYIHAA